MKVPTYRTYPSGDKSDLGLWNPLARSKFGLEIEQNHLLDRFHVHYMTVPEEISFAVTSSVLNSYLMECLLRGWVDDSISGWLRSLWLRVDINGSRRSLNMYDYSILDDDHGGFSNFLDSWEETVGVERYAPERSVESTFVSLNELLASGILRWSPVPDRGGLAAEFTRYEVVFPAQVVQLDNGLSVLKEANKGNRKTPLYLEYSGPADDPLFLFEPDLYLL